MIFGKFCRDEPEKSVLVIHLDVIAFDMIGNMHIICEFDTSLLTYDDKVNE